MLDEHAFCQEQATSQYIRIQQLMDALVVIVDTADGGAGDPAFTLGTVRELAAKALREIG